MQRRDPPERDFLRDLVFELNSIMREEQPHDGALPGYPLGLRRVMALIHHQMELFQIDQSDFPEPLLDPNDWFAGRTAA
jgi:hypothetical protein